MLELLDVNPEIWPNFQAMRLRSLLNFPPNLHFFQVLLLFIVIGWKIIINDLFKESGIIFKVFNISAILYEQTFGRTLTSKNIF